MPKSGTKDVGNTVSTTQVSKREQVEEIIFRAITRETHKGTANRIRHGVVEAILALIEDALQDQADEIAHITEDGYCCACSYDLACMEEEIEKARNCQCGQSGSKE